MRILRTLVLLLPIATAACGVKQPPVVTPQPPPAVAVDAVVTNTSEQALEGAEVIVDGVSWGVTNTDGYLVNNAVEPGQRQYAVSAEGHLPAEGAIQVPGENIRVSLEPVVVAPPPITLERLVVESNKRWFGTSAGREDYREVSAFSLLAQVIYEGIESADAWMAEWQSLGYNAGRVAASFTLYPGGQLDPERTPGYWEAVHALNQRAGERGFRIRWTLWMASEPWGGVWHPDRRDIWSGSVRAGGEAFGRRFVTETRHYPHILYELANEPGEIGMRDSFDELIAFGREVKALAPDVLLNAGSPQHEGDQRFTREPFDFLDAHLPREYINHESWVSSKRKTDHPLVQPHDQPTRMPFIEGEPTNFDGPIPGRGDYDPSTASAFCAAAVSRLTSSYMTFHYDGGIYGERPSGLVRTLADAFRRGLDMVPMFDTYQLWRGHHAESSVRRAPFAPDDDPRSVQQHVDRGNLWRVVGAGNIFVGLLEHKDFNMQRYADRPITTLHREVFGNYACGVYQQ